MPRPLPRAFRLSLLFAAGLLPLLLLAALCAAQQKKHTTSMPTGENPKNVQVLKKLSPDALIDTMRTYNNSLGFGCYGCHVTSGWDKDTKPAKAQARAMILMNNDLNKRYKTLKKKVTCWTCHAGKALPVSPPPAP